MTGTPALPARTPADEFQGPPMPRAADCPFDPPHILPKMQTEVPITRVR
ncbi:MAG TPA: hypothetical protein VF070_00860 [Streptosporangiaceae bacterium]